MQLFYRNPSVALVDATVCVPRIVQLGRLTNKGDRPGKYRVFLVNY